MALVTATLSPYAGGLSASIPNLAWALERRGMTGIHVVGVEDPADPDAARDWGPHVHPHRARRSLSFGFAPGIERTLVRLAPDVVDVQGLWTYPSMAAHRHCRRTGTPAVVTPRGMLDPWARTRSSWKKRVVRLLFQDAQLAEARCLRATAAMEAEHFRSFGLRAPIAVVPNGVDIPPRRETPPSPRRKLLFLSRIHPKKGLPLLLQAWERLAPSRSDWDLVIAGPDEVGHRSEMQRLADTKTIPRIEWRAAVHGEAKSDLYRSADLFVLPTHAENFGLVIAEALAHRVPVVTTRNAPWSGVQDHRCGWWIDLEAEALHRTLTEATALPRSALRDMGDRGRVWMEREFGWDGIADRMVGLYETVAAGTTLPDAIRFD